MGDDKKTVLSQDDVNALLGGSNDPEAERQHEEMMSFETLRPKYKTLPEDKLDRLIFHCVNRKVNYDRIFEIATEIKLIKVEGHTGVDLRAHVISNLTIKRDMLLLLKKNGLATDLKNSKYLSSISERDLDDELLNLRLYILEME